MKTNSERAESLLDSVEEALRLIEAAPSKKNLVDHIIEPRGRPQRELLLVILIRELVIVFGDLLCAFSRRSLNLFHFKNRFNRTEKTGDRYELPWFALFILSYIVAEKDQESVTGDLVEEYRAAVECNGLRKARQWLYWQTFQSAWPLMMKTVRDDVYLPLSSWIQDTFSIVKTDTSGYKNNQDEGPSSE